MSDGIILPDNIQIDGDSGQFFTIVTVEDDPGEDTQDDHHTGDLLVCGQCRAQFSQVQEFIDHKTRCCNTEEKPSTTDLILRVDPGVLSGDTRINIDGVDVTHVVLDDSTNNVLPFDDTISINNTEEESTKKSGLEINLLPQKQQSKKVSSSKKLFCSYCQKEFSKAFDLDQHVRSHTGEKPYQCVICGRGFAQKSNVKKHMATHKVWPLQHNTLPSSQTSLISETKSSYQCQYCKHNFTKYTDFKTHLKTHEDHKSYKCQVSGCGQLFQDLDMFLDHSSLHDNKQFRCHVCSHVFGDLGQLNLHSYAHLTDEQTREKQFFQCSKCKNKYTSIEALNHHMDTATHSFNCDICDKEFSAERLLRKHLAVTHSEAMFECKVCKKKMKNETYLKSHMLIHSGELPYECNVCDAKFNRKDKLKRHILIHSEEKQFKCPFRDHTGCSKEFHRFDKLKLHIMTHSNMRPFKCEVCDSGFSRKEHLATHVAKVHRGGTGKFQCSNCDQVFNKNSDLTEHMRCVHKQVVLPKKSSKRKSGDKSSCEIYQLPDKIHTVNTDISDLTTDASSARQLDTFTREIVDINETVMHVLENVEIVYDHPTVGDVASKAMEILYSQT